MSQVDLMVALKQLEREREIPSEQIQGIIEDAVCRAFQSGASKLQPMRVDFAEGGGKLGVYRVLETVEDESIQPGEDHLYISLTEARKINEDAQPGDLVDVSVPLDEFRRIGVQTIKQHIVQRVREAERSVNLDKFYDKVGQIVTGTVSRHTKNDIIISLDKIDGVLTYSEKIPNEKYPIGKRLKVFVLEIRQGIRDTEIIVSRSNPEFVRKLFELEVPEISQGIVEIKNIVREAGYRTKMAVVSNQFKVDPVGACVGHKGSRVKNIVNELSGEKIDIIHWNDDPAQFIAHALSPAQVISVEIFDEHNAEVIVPDNQLSLAIGKSGQNARLANKLTRWKIDILSEGEKDRLENELRTASALEDSVTAIGLPTRVENLLVESGIRTVKELLSKTRKELESIPGFGDKSFEELQVKLQNFSLVLKDAVPNMAFDMETGGETNQGGEPSPEQAGEAASPADGE